MRYQDLCKPCAEALKKTKMVAFVAGGVNNKITCTECGRRRFGATYQVGRRKKP